MSAKYQSIKGFADLFGAQSALFTRLEDSARACFALYGFAELRTPILEYTELFQRGIGSETDVVQKEMFSLLDRKGRSLSLRPEATAGVLRAAIERGLKEGEIQRLFSFGPMFRYERPQKGRQRQFHQINCECLGTESPFADAELITMLLDYLGGLGLNGLTLRLNSLGCRACRPGYLAALRAYLASLAPERLCADCLRRREQNPLRVLDCKEENCREAIAHAPELANYLCEDCASHFAKVRQLLESVPENLAQIVLDSRLVRGLDYYCRTTFEVLGPISSASAASGLGAQSAIAGGGRYDGLLAQLGGADLPGLGFAIGMERLALLLEESPAPGLDFFIAAQDSAGENKARDLAFVLARELRKQGFSGEMAYQQASFKSMFRQASRLGARYCLIIGSSELASGLIGVKDMVSGGQIELARESLGAYLQKAKVGREEN